MPNIPLPICRFCAVLRASDTDCIDYSTSDEKELLVSSQESVKNPVRTRHSAVAHSTNTKPITV